MMKPIIEEIAGAPAPQDVFKKLKKYPYSFFLDSSLDDGKLGRFSFLGCDPFLVFKSKSGVVTLESREGKTSSLKANPFLILKEILKRYKLPSSAGRLPLTAGAIGYFSYDMKDYVEELPDKAADDLNLPDCILGFYDSVIVFDHVENKAFIAASGLPETVPTLAVKKAAEDIKRIKNIILERCPDENMKAGRSGGINSNFTKSSYIEAINKAKDYIRKGDIYQVNISQRFEAPLKMDPFELYLRLRQASPAPFSSFLNFGEVLILSSSPERFLLKKGRYIETRPIKGTRPRGKDVLSDMFLEKELIKSPKDNAEHIMIVDLERNDLGRICECGSVFPAERAVIEKYSNVFHLVSTVTGKLKEGIDPVDCLMAAFPGGSITGAPKIRSMQIIEELEPVKRSIYTGAIGYISFDGNMDTSVVIRTFVVKKEKVYFSVGGGIVADSVPEDEYAETIDKAQGLMAALGAEAKVREAVMA